MVEDYSSIMKNDVWDIVPIPKGNPVVRFKWIYKIKHTSYGSVEKFKVRFVARRFSYEEGVDYNDTFTHVSKYTSIKFLHVYFLKYRVEDTSYGCEDRVPQLGD